MMIQHTYIDCSPKPESVKPANKNCRTWCFGNSLVTISSESMDVYTIMIRRPAGLTIFESKIENTTGKINLGNQELDLPQEDSSNAT